MGLHDSELYHGERFHHDVADHDYNWELADAPKTGLSYDEAQDLKQSVLPTVYHEHSHHQSLQPPTHHTAPHVMHHPRVVEQHTPVAVDHYDLDHHSLTFTHHELARFDTYPYAASNAEASPEANAEAVA